MGAFDSYVRDRYSGYVSSDTPATPKKEYQYFDNQSSFEFFKGFEMLELKALLAEAELACYDTVWVPDKYGKSSGKGLHTWYVKALINQYDKD